MKTFLSVNRDVTAVWRSSLFAVRLLALAMASLAFSGVLWVTEPAGPGYQASSAAYLGTAESLATGHGFRVPTADWSSADSTSQLDRYAPGFAIAMAVPVWMGFPPAQAARLVEALAAFVAMAMLLAIVGDAAGPGAAALLGLALLVMPIMVDLHLSVLSEPLFLACMALTFALMVAAPEAALAAGVCAALALAVRYTGIAVVAALVLWMLTRAGTWRARVRRAATAALPSVLVVGVWMWIVTRSATASRVRSPMSAIGAGGVHAHDGIVTMTTGAAVTLAQWLVPTMNEVSWMWWVAVPAAAAVFAVLAVGTRRTRRLWELLPRDVMLSSSTNVPQLLAARVLGASAVLGGTYAAMLVAAPLFTDRSIALGGRMLAPLVMLLSAAIAVAAAGWWRSASRLARGGLIGALVVWGAASFRVSRAQAHDAVASGVDLANDAWRRSSLLEWARSEAEQRPVYSNWPAVGYLYLGRPTRGVPSSTDPQVLRAFADTLAARGGGGVILAFSAANPAYVPVDSLIGVLGLQVLARYPDGQVLGPASH